MRRLLLGLALAILAAVSAAETPTIVVEDWSRQRPDRTGVPDGWSGHSWGSPRFEFTVVSDGPTKALHLRSRGVTDADPGFLRRLAGHLENGRDSVSDPALGAPQS